MALHDFRFGLELGCALDGSSGVTDLVDFASESAYQKRLILSIDVNCADRK
jgi:hypothetical protein